ncbi:tyrosine-type recombinase/integrase [Bacteroides propionicifaciens]|uniref:tyrosine-type recombinase/integrase n=1 Tax=Bacteroides propionicifaciens TaxID=392838 RepID=UPI0003750740|nr:site-specific integrase [Bacteroides propionicifaciens]
MAKKVSAVKENPRLEQRKSKQGIIRLSLRYNLGTQAYTDDNTGETKYKTIHKRESLDLSLIASPRTPADRALNKETLELAQKIRFEKEQQFKEQKDGYRLERNKDINFLDFFESYIYNYNKKDKRNLKVAYNRFKDFLQDEPQYNIYKDYIKPQQLTKDMMRLFVEYLQSRSIGEGAKTIYQRFKKVINYAIEQDLILKNPCIGVVCKADDSTLRKDILSMEEIKQLIQTEYKDQNPQVRDAFIFCLCTGLRFCDVDALTYSSVDYSNKTLTFEQHKTRGHSANSGVVVPLSNTALTLIGKPSTNTPSKELIFELPSYTACSKALKRWIKRAKIDKHITWHCARHSFATNSLMMGANIAVVGSLLGHSGLRHTMRYLKAVDAQKREATNRMNFNI